MDTVNEGSTAYLTVTFLDKDGNEQVPTSATWEAHDKRSGTQLQEQTDLTPAGSIEITIPPAVNAILRSGSPSEVRQITVQASYGSGDAVTGQYEYAVINLGQVQA